MATLILKSQSAMEYLMTYGWAILIIAVVLGALYYLGVFSAATSGPRAQPGSCRVLRPLGPGTISYINLEGVCTGLLPQFVAQFNGQTSYISLGTPTVLAGLQVPVTISGWFKQYSTSTQAIYAAYGGTSGNTLWSMIRMNPNVLQYFTSTASGSYQTVGTLIPTINSWHYFAIVVSGNIVNPQLIIYLDSNSESPSLSSLSGTPDTTVPIYIGADAAQLTHENFNGAISNVQVYNTALDANQIRILYAEGIGGAPISPQYLVGWWPLNGNASDYSGNNNNGANNGAVFTSTWTR